MDGDSTSKTLKTGTTTVGILSRNGVVLASDRRATMGYLIASKDIDKIYPISDNIAMTIAGGVGDAQTLVRWMQAEIKLYSLRQGKKMSVPAAATLLANILVQYKYYPFFVQLLIAGYDAKPHLYSVDMLGGVTEEKIASTGSGSPIAYGVLEGLYKEDAPTSEHAKVAAKAISVAIKRDAATGEHIDLCVVDENGFRRYSKDEVKQILA